LSPRQGFRDPGYFTLPPRISGTMISVDLRRMFLPCCTTAPFRPVLGLATYFFFFLPLGTQISPFVSSVRAAAAPSNSRPPDWSQVPPAPRHQFSCAFSFFFFFDFLIFPQPLRSQQGCFTTSYFLSAFRDFACPVVKDEAFPIFPASCQCFSNSVIRAFF